MIGKNMIRLLLLSSLLFLNPFTLSAEDRPALFQPENGDSIVFLGGTLIERAQQYGFWESMLISETADKNIIFRNLGWSGDTVFAESRGIFDPPAVGYKRMIERIKKIDPRYIFVSYGGNESFKGAGGIVEFLNQLEILMKDLTGKNTNVILITPMLYEKMPAPLPDPTAVNVNRTLYIKALKQFGKVHNIPVLDPVNSSKEVLKFFRQSPNNLTYNGIHLTSEGYYRSSNHIKGKLFPSFSNLKLVLNAAGNVTTQKGLTVSDINKKESGFSFQLKRNNLPVVNDKNRVPLISQVKISFEGLTDGNYTLSVDGEPALTASYDQWSKGKYTLTASAQEWNDGRFIQSQSELKQARKLQQMILDKNELYFHGWRPQNITYLFGFRKHEQGNNAKDIDELMKLVEKKEKAIYSLQNNRTRKYTLTKN